MTGERTDRTLAEVLGLTDEQQAEMHERLTERLDAIRENERQAHIATQGVWLG